MYIERTLKTSLEKATKHFPAILVIGMRQVGKTTFLKHLAGNDRTYITLDDPILASLAKQEPKLFLERFKAPLLIDEIQYAPELLPHIKMHIDNSHIPGQFWLSGSQQFHLMKGISESLAGRVGLLNLLGLSQWESRKQANADIPFLPTYEYLQQRQSYTLKEPLQTIYSKIWRGSFPAIALNDQMDQNLFYSSYVQTYLQRDVRDLAKVGDEQAFLRFLRITAARTGQLINMADLARDIDISPNTAKNWLSILQASGIIYLLQPYYNNINSRMVKSPKLYFLDTGLCSYLTQWSDPKTLEAGAMSGAILETFVIAEIIKSYWHNGLEAPIYYYRDKDKIEIDLLIVKNQIIHPVEIKKTSLPTKESFQQFKVLKKLNAAIGPGAVICLTDLILPLAQDVNAIPVALI